VLLDTVFFVASQADDRLGSYAHIPSASAFISLAFCLTAAASIFLVLT